MHVQTLTFLALLASACAVFAAESTETNTSASASPAAATADAAPAASYDAELAKRLGADEHGMRKYVLAILKTGPTRVPDGPERDAMFAGHFANIERLAKAGKLAVAGPFTMDPSGWRGLYVFAVDDIAAARALTETDPVIVKGEMVAEYHDWYGSAATLMIPELHAHLVQPAAKPDAAAKPAAKP